MIITIVFDNYPSEPSLKTGFGFACVVEAQDKKILFDTGSEGDILLYNLERLEISPSEIDCIVLSHNHWDHTGGLREFLRRNSEPIIYLPAGFPDEFKDKAQNSGASMIEVDTALKIIEGIYSTGTISGVMDEQSLVCRTGRGLMVITGCAHPGIVRIVKEARKISDNVHLAMGGFHLGGLSPLGMQDIIDDFRELGVLKVCPTHCSGDLARKMFSEAYGENCIMGGVGTKIEID